MAGIDPRFIGDALGLLPMVVLSIGVLGIVSLPTLALKIHAAGMTVVLGVVAVALVSIATGNADIAARAFLVGVLLLFTTPLAAHVIARAAWRRGELLDGEEPHPAED